MSHCLDVIPGKDEKDRDDSRDWSSDVASNLSMAIKTRQTSQSAWLKKTKPRPFRPQGGRQKKIQQVASKRSVDKPNQLLSDFEPACLKPQHIRVTLHVEGSGFITSFIFVN